MESNVRLNCDTLSKDNVKKYVDDRVKLIKGGEDCHDQIRNIIEEIFKLNKEKLNEFTELQFDKPKFTKEILRLIKLIGSFPKHATIEYYIKTVFDKNKETICMFFKNNNPRVSDFIIASMIKISNNLGEKSSPEQNTTEQEYIALFCNVFSAVFAVIILVSLFTFYFKLKSDTGSLVSEKKPDESKLFNQGDLTILEKNFCEIGKSLSKQIGELESLKGFFSDNKLLKSLSASLDNNTEELKTKGGKPIVLSGDQIVSAFKAIIEDDKSEFGKMIKKINEFVDKKPVKSEDTSSTKDKNDLAGLKGENDKLNKSIGDREKEISKEKDAVSKLTNDITLKAIKILELEAKIKSIDNEKIGFKGFPGSYAILLTNSADFQLPKPLLETVMGVLEKQNGTSLDAQKFGMYIATGEKISTRYDLRNKSKSQNPTEPEPLIGRPTECIIEVGNSFFKNAFGDGKEPAIPIADRKVIIIATWSAKAPKFDSDGWDKISQVDAILIQTPKNKDLREASNWLDFIIKKNGRLLFVQGTDDFSGGTPAIDQLQKHLSTLLNTKKD